MLYMRRVFWHNTHENNLAFATKGTTMTNPMPWSPDDVYRMEFVENPTWSPDGTTRLYVHAKPDRVKNGMRRSIWMRRGNETPRRFSAGTASDRMPQWSPDGRMVAFVSSRGGDGAQLYVMPADGGEAESLTSLPAGVSGFAWSPDSQRIALVSYPLASDLEAEAHPGDAPQSAFEAEQRKAQHTHDQKQRIDPRVINELPFRTGTDYIEGRRGHLYVLEVAKGQSSITRVTTDARDYGTPSWSRDGQSVWSIAKIDPAATAYFVGRGVAQISVNEPHTVTMITDDVYSIGSSPVVSPDGEWLAAIGMRADAPFHGGAHLLVRRLTAGAPWQRLNLNDANLGNWQWLPDSSGIAYVAEWHGQGPVHTVSLPGRTAMPIQATHAGPGQVVDEFWVRADGGIAYTQGGPAFPCELFEAHAGQVQQITTLYTALLAERTTTAFEELWYPSADGQMVQGWLLAPPQVEAGKQYGLVLHIHGGPHAMWSPGTRSMWLEWQATASAGMYVFFCNPRGSEGYGLAWQAGSMARWGHADQPDFEAGIDAVLAKGLPIDTQRIGVTGGSYGGFMTTWLIGHSQRFAAAVSARGVYNLITEHSMSDAYELVEYSFGLNPWQHAEQLWQASPIAAVEQMHAPLLILHSELDFRVPIGEAEQLYTMLRRLGRTVEMVRYPREGHELTRSGEPNHQIDHMRRTIEWFVRYIGVAQ